jgi:hypothetical protein
MLDSGATMGTIRKSASAKWPTSSKPSGTTSGPIHRAIWDSEIPCSLFSPDSAESSADCESAMQKSLEIVRRRRDSGGLFDANHKI